jgi:hypothetical protein
MNPEFSTCPGCFLEQCLSNCGPWTDIGMQSIHKRNIWATVWIIGVLGFDSRRGLGILLFTTASRTALGPTQPPIQWVPGAVSLGLKRPGREADYSHPSSAEVRECVTLYLHSPNTPSWRGAQLKHRDNFTFTSYLYIILTARVRFFIHLIISYSSVCETVVCGPT